MNEYTSKVYVLTDEFGRILRCEGGYTMSNIDDISQWVLIDEGEGDRYNLCQSQYFNPPLYTEDGIPQWKYVYNLVRERSAEEIEEDRKAIPPLPPSDHELLMTLLGVAT